MTISKLYWEDARNLCFTLSGRITVSYLLKILHKRNFSIFRENREHLSDRVVVIAIVGKSSYGSLGIKVKCVNRIFANTPNKTGKEVSKIHQLFYFSVTSIHLHNSCVLT